MSATRGEQFIDNVCLLLVITPQESLSVWVVEGHAGLLEKPSTRLHII